MILTLITLFLEVSRPFVNRVNSLRPITDPALSEWTRSWWNWTKKTGPKKELPPRPSDVSNDFLLCKHGGVCFDLPKEVETAKTIAIATQDDWRYLQTAYKAGPEIRIWIDRGATEPSSHPRVCAECLDEK
jgi:hypothetical protein